MESALLYEKWVLWIYYESNIYIIIISLRENFMQKKILSSCELAENVLSRNYNMDSYIPNDVNRKRN